MNLKANTNFQQMQSDLADIENKLAGARRLLKNAVQAYSTGIQQSPVALFATGFGFTPYEFIDVGEDCKILDHARLDPYQPKLPECAYGATYEAGHALKGDQHEFG